MTQEQGIAIGLVIIIGYIGWLTASLFLYCERRKKKKLEGELKSLEKER